MNLSHIRVPWIMEKEMVNLTVYNVVRITFRVGGSFVGLFDVGSLSRCKGVVSLRRWVSDMFITASLEVILLLILRALRALRPNLWRAIKKIPIRMFYSFRPPTEWSIGYHVDDWAQSEGVGFFFGYLVCSFWCHNCYPEDVHHIHWKTFLFVNVVRFALQPRKRH